MISTVLSIPLLRYLVKDLFTLFTVVKNWVVNIFDVRRARYEYDVVTRECNMIERGMGLAVRAADRARVLTSLAIGYMAAADLHAVAYGIRFIGEGARGLGESLAWQAGIYRCLAYVEYAIASQSRRRLGGRRLEAAVGYLLDETVWAGSLTRRLQGGLYRGLLPVTGARAADAVLAIPVFAARGGSYFSSGI